MDSVQATELRHLLVMTEAQGDALEEAVARDWSVETAAFILASAVPTPGGACRLVTVEVLLPPDEAYEVRDTDRLRLSAAYMATVYQAARARRCAVVQAHSHPDGSLVPSATDLATEAQVLPRLRYHAPGQPHGRLILTPMAAHARLFLPEGQDEALQVQVVGRNLRALTAADDLDPDTFDRQIRAFGEGGQARLQGLRVAVVGCGGTGSLTAQHLAHLGVGQVRLYDPDRLERSNLNRVVGATPADVGRLKVEVAAELIRRVRPSAVVEPRPFDVTASDVARSLLDVDLVLACTDSHGSRAVLSQLAYQYYLPVIDVGVNIHLQETGQVHIAGRAQMLSPSLPCLLCSRSLNPQKVRADLMGEVARRADPYLVGAAVPEPAVISLNATATGLAVSMMLAAVTGFPIASRYTLLRLDTSQLRTPDISAEAGCAYCSAQGALGQADDWVAPGRPA